MIAKTATRNSLIVFVENVFVNQATLEMEKPAFLLCLVSAMHVLVSELYIISGAENSSRKSKVVGSKSILGGGGE